MKVPEFSPFSIIWFLAFIGLMACTSCMKEKDRHLLCGDNNQIEMRIVEYGTQVPIEGADVYLIVTDGMGNNPSVVENFVTDHSGLVSWSCDLDVESICAQKPDLYYGSCGQGYSLGMTWVADGVYELFPHAWVKVTAVDVEPFNPDVMIVAVPPASGGSGDWVFLLNNESSVMPAFGNMNDEVLYSIRPFSNDTSYYASSISVFVGAFDTTYYEILY